MQRESGESLKCQRAILATEIIPRVLLCVCGHRMLVANGFKEQDKRQFMSLFTCTTFVSLCPFFTYTTYV